jgi:hypothetical protein
MEKAGRSEAVEVDFLVIVAATLYQASGLIGLGEEMIGRPSIVASAAQQIIARRPA